MVGIENIESGSQYLFAPFVTFWEKVIMSVPSLLAAAVIFFFGYFIAKFLGLLIKEILIRLGLDAYIERTGKHEMFGGASISRFVASLLRWYIFALFIVASADQLSIEPISEIMAKIGLWIPQLIAGIIVIIIGIIIADVVEQKISHARNIHWIKLIAPFLRVFILIFFILTAFTQMGFTISLAEDTFKIIVGALSLTLSLAIGIPLGFALRKDMDEVVKKIKKSF